MNLKEMKPAYTMRDMVKVLRRVDELTRENNVLRKQLMEAKEHLEAAQSENGNLTSQLFDLQGDFARQMTTPYVLPVHRENN
jgi:predicted nuclease with TOPRIM domain